MFHVERIDESRRSLRPGSLDASTRALASDRDPPDKPRDPRRGPHVSPEQPPSSDNCPTCNTSLGLPSHWSEGSGRVSSHARPGSLLLHSSASNNPACTRQERRWSSGLPPRFARSSTRRSTRKTLASRRPTKSRCLAAQRVLLCLGSCPRMLAGALARMSDLKPSSLRGATRECLELTLRNLGGGGRPGMSQGLPTSWLSPIWRIRYRPRSPPA